MELAYTITTPNGPNRVIGHVVGGVGQHLKCRQYRQIGFDLVSINMVDEDQRQAFQNALLSLSPTADSEAPGVHYD